VNHQQKDVNVKGGSTAQERLVKSKINVGNVVVRNVSQIRKRRRNIYTPRKNVFFVRRESKLEHLKRGITLA
jgi:hypothetical protein